jgi:hypothetical protein
MENTVCQKITQALLEPHRYLTVTELIRETGVPGPCLLPVLNRMVGTGGVIVRGNRVARLTFVRAGGF